MTINEYLQNQKIIADGSFGTYYAEKYQTKELAEKLFTKVKTAFNKLMK